MDKIRVVIVDDEAIPRKWLSLAIEKNFPDLEVLDTYDSVESGVAGIKKHNPDLVFLDIEMQDGNAFNLLDELDEINFKIIFTTAHEQYAIKAIKMSALDYLLKPIILDELKKALSRFTGAPTEEKSARILSENYKNHFSQENKIVLPTQEGYDFAKIKDIIYCASDANYTIIKMLDGSKRIISRTLKEYDEILSQHNFFRIHQSYLINLNHIEKYIRTQQAQIEMCNGDVLQVSRSKKEEFLKRLKNL